MSLAKSTSAISRLALSNPLSTLLDKPAADFNRTDLLEVIAHRQIERIAFHYTALDGKLKELKLPISSAERVERILAEGERVDGSSLFNGVVEPGKSDLYVVPVYRSAFLNPFDDRSLDFVCRFLDRKGDFAAFAPDNILRRAAERLKQNTGLELRALGELEFYLLGDEPGPLYPAEQQRGYHASAPFLKSGSILDEMLHHLERITGAVKYGHAEVGWIGSLESEHAEIRGKTAEQIEIEFLPKPLEDCADSLVLARWIIRNIACRHNRVATFVPKLEEGIAGSGLHFHMELTQDGKNMMTNRDGSLSDKAMRLIGGLCSGADSLTAFGNTMAASYLRLVPNQEAPTRICWSDMNRSALIRVPLGWNNVGVLADKVNPTSASKINLDSTQTVELRTPDGSALIHLLLAGVALIANWGLTESSSIHTARERYVTAAGLNEEPGAAGFPKLPASCAESADLLLSRRDFFERDGVFPPKVIDYVAELLRAEEDADMGNELHDLGPQQRSKSMRKIMHRDLHRH